MSRIVSWFSAGAASAVATKLMLEENPDTIVANIHVANEHPDNQRFLTDCERWFGKPVVRLASTRYADCWEVWEKRRFLNSPKGALCTTEMKKMVRQDFEEPGDIQVFGFTNDKRDKARAERHTEVNFEYKHRFPLIERRISKIECYDKVRAAGLQLPAMYRLGYHNANCIGCVKGGKGYWNKIRKDFPEVFARMSALEEQIGHSVIQDTPLRSLKPNEGRHTDLELPDCGLFCS